MDQSNSQLLCSLACRAHVSPKTALSGIVTRGGDNFQTGVKISRGDHHPHITQRFSGQAHSSSQTASRSIQPFCIGHKCYAVQCVVNEKKTQKLPLPIGISSPCRRRTEPRPYQHAQKFCKDCACGSRDILADRQTDTHKYTHTETLITTSQPLPRPK